MLGQKSIDALLESKVAPKVEVKEEPKKRMTPVIKKHCKMLKRNGLNAKAIAKTVDFSINAVEAALKGV